MKHTEKIHIAKFRPQFFTFSWHQTPGERQWPMYRGAPETNGFPKLLPMKVQYCLNREK